MGFNVSGLMVMGRMGLMVCPPRQSRPSRRRHVSSVAGSRHGETNWALVRRRPLSYADCTGRT